MDGKPNLSLCLGALKEIEDTVGVDILSEAVDADLRDIRKLAEVARIATRWGNPNMKPEEIEKAHALVDYGDILETIHNAIVPKSLKQRVANELGKDPG